MAGFVFNRGALRLLNGSTVWTSSPIYARLVPSVAAVLDPDADAMTGIGSVEATAEVLVTTPVGPTLDDANDRVTYGSDNLEFPSASIAIGEVDRVVFYHKVTNDADSFPIAYCDIVPITPTGGDIEITMDSIGWFYIAVGQEISAMLPDLYEYSYTLTDAQIKALATPTPVEILPAPGAGYIWAVIQLDMIIDAAAGAYGNFTDLAYVELTHTRSDNLVNDASVGFTQLTDFFGYAGVNYASLRGQFSTEADSAFTVFSGYGNINKVIKDVDADDNDAVSIQIAGNSGPLTGGNAANTMKIRVLAMKIAL